MSWLKLATPAVAQLSLVLFKRCLVRIVLRLRFLSRSVTCRGAKAFTRGAGDKPTASTAKRVDPLFIFP